MNAHGGKRRYEDGCRCDVCKNGHRRRMRNRREGDTLYMREYRARQRANAESTPRVPPSAIYEQGACVGYPTRWWFSTIGEGVRREDGAATGDSARALAICATCPVVDTCRDWAVDNGEIGIWGGTLQGERRLLRRKRGIPERPTFTPEPPQRVRLHGGKHGGEVVA